MNNLISKKKIVAIAVSIFLITVSTVFIVVGGDELKVNEKSMQAFIINEHEFVDTQDENEYRKILNNYDDDFIIVNTDRTFKFISSNLLNVHGYSLEETAKMNVLTFIHPKDLPLFSNMLMQFHKELKTMNNIGPIRVKTKEDVYINYLITLTPFTNAKGERIGTGVILKNIDKPLGDTEKKA